MEARFALRRKALIEWSGVEVAFQSRTLIGSQHCFGLQRRQIDSHRDRNSAAGVELHVLNRAYLIVAALAFVERSSNARSVFEQQVHLFWKRPPLLELHASHRWVVDFDQQHAAKLAVAAEDFVVGVDLVLDVGLFDHSFNADHFLNLVLHGQMILKQKRQVFANVNSPNGLRRHYFISQSIALFLVGYVIDDFISLYWFHFSSPCSFFASTCFSKPSSR